MATLETTLSLNTSGFVRGLRGSVRSVKQFNREIGAPLVDGARNIAKMTAAAVAFGAAVAAVQIKRFADMGDQLDKMSKRTGLAVDELSRFKHAAELSGTSLEGVEKAVRKMQMGILDAGQGMATAVETFHELGVSAASLQGMDTGGQFDALLEGLAGVTDSSTRAALAQRVFGKSGTALLPMLSDGVAGLRSMKSEADALGVVFSQDQVNQSALFNDNLLRVRRSMQGLANSVIGLDRLNAKLQSLTAIVIKLRQNRAFQEWVANFKAGAVRTISYVAGLAKAIYDFNVNSGGNLLKFAAIFAGVALAFRMNLVVPILKAAILLTKGLVTLLVGPVVAALGVLGAAISGFAIGQALEKSFDLSGIVARTSIQMGALAKTFGNLFANLTDPKGFEAAQEALIKEMDESLARIKPEFSGNFLDNLAESFEGIFAGVANATDGIFDKLVPDSLQTFMDDLKGLGQGIALPALNFDMPNIGNNVADGARRGVIDGLADAKFGLVGTRDASDRTPSRAEEASRKLDERIARASEQMKAQMAALINKGAMVF
jgi:hypothetical protein